MQEVKDINNTSTLKIHQDLQNTIKSPEPEFNSEEAEVRRILREAAIREEKRKEKRVRKSLNFEARDLQLQAEQANDTAQQQLQFEEAKREERIEEKLRQMERCAEKIIEGKTKLMRKLSQIKALENLYKSYNDDSEEKKEETSEIEPESSNPSSPRSPITEGLSSNDKETRNKAIHRTREVINKLANNSPKNKKESEDYLKILTELASTPVQEEQHLIKEMLENAIQNEIAKKNKIEEKIRDQSVSLKKESLERMLNQRKSEAREIMAKRTGEEQVKLKNKIEKMMNTINMDDVKKLAKIPQDQYQRVQIEAERHPQVIYLKEQIEQICKEIENSKSKETPEIQQNSKRFNELISAKESIQSNIKIKEYKIEKLEKKIKDANERKKKTENDSEKTNETDSKDNNEKGNDSDEEELDQLRSEHEQEESKMQELEKECERLNGEKETLNEECSKMSNERNNLINDLKGIEENIGSVNSQLQDEEQQKKSSQEKTRKLEEEKDQLNNQIKQVIDEQKETENSNIPEFCSLIAHNLVAEELWEQAELTEKQARAYFDELKRSAEDKITNSEKEKEELNQKLEDTEQQAKAKIKEVSEYRAVLQKIKTKRRDRVEEAQNTRDTKHEELEKKEKQKATQFGELMGKINVSEHIISLSAGAEEFRSRYMAHIEKIDLDNLEVQRKEAKDTLSKQMYLENRLRKAMKEIQKGCRKQYLTESK
eukprot:gb/GECH01003294.1/.p1 GENE.gb/GECH01003294.1/~~gb/GECH01003294.1/.p1  ORF type:complete len:715 (+),score=262.41 gb/GECH01003294.1/:1-2145(+)